MSEATSYLVLGLLVLVGSAVPFVPTGELVSGAAALSDMSVRPAVTIFVISWAASLGGDTLLLLEARASRGRVERWLDRRALAARVRRAQLAVLERGTQAIVVGRLVPGGRAPVILALGLSRYPVRRFVGVDAVACAMWATVYTLIGTVGGSVVGQPVWGVVIAIAAALALGGAVRLAFRVPRSRSPEESRSDARWNRRSERR